MRSGEQELGGMTSEGRKEDEMRAVTGWIEDRTKAEMNLIQRTDGWSSVGFAPLHFIRLASF